MKIISVGSGSKGNCFFIQDQNTSIMLDCGMGIKMIRKARSLYHIDTIDGLLLTHGHSDHIKCKNYFKDICSYALDAQLKPDYCCNNMESFKINQLMITPFALSHDAPNTCGYLIENDAEKVFYCTDTGYIPTSVLDIGKNCTYYIIESNHDIDLLMATNRPYVLKSRILGDSGHLNNQDCAYYLSQMVGNNTQQIYLAHISQQANNALLAYQVNHDYLNDKGWNIPITVLKQDEIMEGGANA